MDGLVTPPSNENSLNKIENNEFLEEKSLKNEILDDTITSNISKQQLNTMFNNKLLSKNLYSRLVSNTENISVYKNNSEVEESSTFIPITIAPQHYKTSSIIQKPRTTPREAVDPMKYISIEEQDGTKYACSKCGNVYKWRKSLNKHWKEKHEGEPLPTQEEREKILKFPPNNLQKNPHVKFLSHNLLNNQQNYLYIPNSSTNAQRSILNGSLNNLEAYTKRENAQSTIFNFSNNSSLLTAINPASPKMKSNIFQNKDSSFNEQGVLDLSFKSPMNQKSEAPLDYSKKTSSQDSKFNSKQNISSTKTVYSCFQCRTDENSLEHLNNHFSIHHRNLLSSVAQAMLHQVGRTTNSEFRCCVCGHSEEWLYKLASHFSEQHNVIGFNPYSSKNNGNKTSTQNNLSIVTNFSSQIAKNEFSSIENKILNINGTQTMVVIPKAPEENIPLENRVIYRPSEKIENSSSQPFFKFSNKTENNFSKLTYCKTQRSKKEFGANGEINLPYQCELCDYKARWPSEMTQHKKNHSDEKPFLCPQCPYRSKWKWDVVKHLKRCGGNKEQTENQNKQRKTKYHNQIENKNDLTKDLNAHYVIQNIKSEDGQNILKSIKIDSNNAGLFHSQLRQSADKKTSFEGTQVIVSSTGEYHNIYPCEQCHFVGHSPAELRRHLRVHSSEKPFACKTCNYSTKWKCDLKKHLKTYHHEPMDPEMMKMNSKKGLDTVNVGEASDSDGMSLCDVEMSQDGKLKCKQCSFEATTLFNIVKHVNEQTCYQKTLKNKVEGEIQDCAIKEEFMKKVGLVKQSISENSLPKENSHERALLSCQKKSFECEELNISTNQRINCSRSDDLWDNFNEIKKSKYFSNVLDSKTQNFHSRNNVNKDDQQNFSLNAFSLSNSHILKYETKESLTSKEKRDKSIENFSDCSDKTEPAEMNDYTANKTLHRENKCHSDINMKNEENQSFDGLKSNNIKRTRFFKCPKCFLISTNKISKNKVSTRLKCSHCSFLWKSFKKTFENDTKNFKKIFSTKGQKNLLITRSRRLRQSKCHHCSFTSVNPSTMKIHKLKRLCKNSVKKIKVRKSFKSAFRDDQKKQGNSINVSDAF